MTRYGVKVFVPTNAGLHLAAMCRREARHIRLTQQRCWEAGGVIDDVATSLAASLDSVAEQLTDSLEEAAE